MPLRWTLEPRETRVLVMDFALDRGDVIGDELEADLQPIEPAGSAWRKAEHVSSRRGLSFVSLSHSAPFVANRQDVSTTPGPGRLTVAPIPPTVFPVPAADPLWHPWLRIQRVLRVMLKTSWSPEAWPRVKAELGKALKERARLKRQGWFN